MLSTEPHLGRLTANLFLKCAERRPGAAAPAPAHGAAACRSQTHMASQGDLDRYLKTGGIYCKLGTCTQGDHTGDKTNPVTVLY